MGWLGGLGGDSEEDTNEERPLHTALVVMKTWPQVWPRCQGKRWRDYGGTGDTRDGGRARGSQSRHRDRLVQDIRWALRRQASHCPLRFFKLPAPPLTDRHTLSLSSQLPRRCVGLVASLAWAALPLRQGVSSRPHAWCFCAIGHLRNSGWLAPAPGAREQGLAGHQPRGVPILGGGTDGSRHSCGVTGSLLGGTGMELGCP